MVNREELTALLELVQAAKGGSFELDRALSEAFGEENEHGVLIVADRWLGIAPISTSIDAALALTDRVGWRLYTVDASIKGRFSVMLAGPLRERWSDDLQVMVTIPDYANEVHSNFCLTIIAATLSALIAQAETP